MHDIVIRGGTIVDGTGAPRFTGDVAIERGRIPAVGAKPGRRGVSSMQTAYWSRRAGSTSIRITTDKPHGTLSSRLHHGMV
jgi:hypothetical protein